MTAPPKCAIVISCYNYARFVGQAIDSVLNQRREDCELVVVDDGSTDGSWEVIARSGATALRIDNRGQLGACLHGLDHTRAPFVMFLDADDALKPGSLAQILARLDPSVAKLQFALTLIDAAGRPIGAGASLPQFRARDELLREVLRTGIYRTPPSSGNVFRRDVCELLREVNYDRAVDGVILFAAPLFGDVVSLSDELGCYRIHGRNDSGVGRGPDIATLERDIARFVARTDHLGAVVQRTTGQQVVDPRETFFFQEQRLYLDIASQRRPAPAQLWRLLKAATAHSFSIKTKLGMLAFLPLVSILPGAQARSLLGYRLQPDRARPLAALLKRRPARGPAAAATISAAALLALSLPTCARAAAGNSCALRPVMLENFKENLSISRDKIGPARWIAHTPWGGDFGDAGFGNPGPGSPFAVNNGVLSITAKKGKDGRWKSGLIAAADASGAGTGTRYGYFEARMKFPPGPGTWPAFWLAAQKPTSETEGKVEIDVVEYYGQFTSAYRTALHVWYKKAPKKTRGTGEKVSVPDGSLVSGYHTYGVDVSPQAIVFFLDRKKVWSQPTPPELDGPLYPLVNLALGSGWPIDKTPNPSTLLVDYVHVYARGAGPPKGCPPGLPAKSS